MLKTFERFYFKQSLPKGAGEYPHKSQRVAGPRKCGAAVGISLLSCKQAEILVIAHVLPVNGGHLDISSHPGVKKSIHASPTVLLDLKNGVTCPTFSYVTFESRHPNYVHSEGRHFDLSVSPWSACP